MIYRNVTELIGNTPIFEMDFGREYAKIYVKLEYFNPGWSIKDRAALGMIEQAESEEILKKGSKIIEPTSGNTGIAIAMIGRQRGYDVTIVMPENMSKERKDLIRALGAKLILTPAEEGMIGSINKALKMKEKDENIFIPQQFVNSSNPDMHYKTTAKEIINEISDLDVFIAGVGTGGTISGIGKRLKESLKDVKIIAIEPKLSAVLSGKDAGNHKIQGIGAGFIPQIYNKDVVDRVITVSDEDAFEMAKTIRDGYGLLLGISASANVFGAKAIAKEMGSNRKIVTVAPDDGMKYISTGIYF